MNKGSKRRTFGDAIMQSKSVLSVTAIIGFILRLVFIMFQIHHV